MAFALTAAWVPAGAAARLTGPLTIKGNRIVDAHGATVTLRGIHLAYLDDPKATGGEAHPDEVALATRGRGGSWGSSMLRIPMGAAQWTGECPSLYSGTAAYRKNMDALVKQVTGLGVVALLDLHASTAGCTSIDRHAMPDAPISQHFWSSVAAHYAKNPLVAFELYNEPHWVSDDIWQHGTSGATVQDCDATEPAASGVALVQQKLALTDCQLKQPSYQAAGMQELYDLVTRTAPHHLVVIDGPGWASAVSTQPVRGTFAYAVHPYACSNPGASCDVSSKAHVNSSVLNRFKAVAAHQPVLATELGWPSYKPGANGGDPVYVEGAGYYRETLAYLERQNPKWGFIAFAWDGGSRSAFSMVTDNHTYAPNSTARPVFDLLRARS